MAHLLHSVHEFYTGNIIFEYADTVAEVTNVSEQNKNTVLEGMRQVVKASSIISSNFKSVPVTVGGKTGTAQVDGKTDYALFAGAAPYDDPEIVGVCIIEEGAMGAYASRTVSEIFKAYYANQEITTEQ